MVLIVLWFVIGVIASLVSSKPIHQEAYKLTPEKILLIQKHVEPCAKEHNVDNEIFGRVIDGTLTHDEPSKKFLYCFGRSIKVTAEDGHIIVDRMGSFIGNHPLLEEFKESLRECNKITKENPYETLIEMNDCLNNNAPVIFSM